MSELVHELLFKTASRVPECRALKAGTTDFDYATLAGAVDAFARARTTSGNQVHCQSREVLESEIVRLVAGRLGFGPGG